MKTSISDRLPSGKIREYAGEKLYLSYRRVIHLAGASLGNPCGAKRYPDPLVQEMTETAYLNNWSHHRQTSDWGLAKM